MSADIQVDHIGVEKEVKFTGSQINYYFICKRKLWLFSHNIELEPESDLVKLGKLLHENRYNRKMKEVQIGRIKVDFMESKRLEPEKDATLTTTPTTSGESSQASVSVIADLPRQPRSDSQNAEGVKATNLRTESEAKQQKELVVHEVKRSKKMQDAHLYQLLYYMYYLKKNYGVNVSRGVLHYPLLKQNVDVPLTEDRIKQVEEAMLGIAKVNSLKNPPEAVRKGYCRSCAYQDLCWG
ncbi:MAG: CRISPR-associated protein Cas4 [Rhabdochlamydiaceae bacterium]